MYPGMYIHVVHARNKISRKLVFLIKGIEIEVSNTFFGAIQIEYRSINQNIKAQLIGYFNDIANEFNIEYENEGDYIEAWVSPSYFNVKSFNEMLRKAIRSGEYVRFVRDRLIPF